MALGFGLLVLFLCVNCGSENDVDVFSVVIGSVNAETFVLSMFKNINEAEYFVVQQIPFIST